MNNKFPPIVVSKTFSINNKKRQNKAKSYNGNLAELRAKRSKMLDKKHRLNLEIKKYDKMTSYTRDGIFKNIEELSWQINAINHEIEKIQKAMQNSDQWMDGDFNNTELE